jgi:hypothetical protein
LVVEEVLHVISDVVEDWLWFPFELTNYSTHVLFNIGDELFSGSQYCERKFWKIESATNDLHRSDNDNASVAVLGLLSDSFSLFFGNFPDQRKASNALLSKS